MGLKICVSYASGGDFGSLRRGGQLPISNEGKGNSSYQFQNSEFFFYRIASFSENVSLQSVWNKILMTFSNIKAFCNSGLFQCSRGCSPQVQDVCG